MSLQQLPAGALRTVVIHEMRKFALALEYGSSISALEAIREQINATVEVLREKELEEETSMSNR